MTISTRRGFTVFTGILLCLPALHAQYMLVDHTSNRLKNDSEGAVEAEPDSGFLADRFSIGAKGEEWVVDGLRLWSRLTIPRGHIGDFFEAIDLFGGLESAPPKPGELECDCHNLIAIQSAALQKGSDAAGGRNVQISLVEPEVWQVDFDNLNWFVPGGVGIQFGLGALPRSDKSTANAAKWFLYTVHTETPHEIRLFDRKGKLTGPFHGIGADASRGFAIQVWGHIPVTIDIQPRRELWEVRLHNAESARLEQPSLRFGPQKAKPVTLRLRGNDLVMTFRAADTGVRSGDPNACLTGQRHDGVPLEGCALLKRGAR